MSTSLPSTQQTGEISVQDVNINDDTDIVNDPPRRYPLRERLSARDNFRINAVTNRDSVVCPTLNQALKSTDDQILLWRAALMTELKTLQKLGTYEVVTKEEIPPDAFVFPTKFVMRQKLTALGEYVKHKARLTVLGNLDKDVPSAELFSPTASDKSLKLVCALAVVLGLVLFGLDVYAAF
jgi:hypothetical protein